MCKAKSGKIFIGFIPAISSNSSKHLRKKVKSWNLWRMGSLNLDEIAVKIRPIIRGWINYFEYSGKSVLKKALQYINFQLIKWVKRKYKKKGKYLRRAIKWLGKVAKFNKNPFPHWSIGV